MSTKHSALVVDSRGTLRCGSVVIATDPLRRALGDDATMDVILRRAAADPEAQQYRAELRQMRGMTAKQEELMYQHRREVLIPRAIAWFSGLDRIERDRMVEEVLREQRARMYWAGVKRCCVRHDDLTEILHRDGSVELFDSRGRRVTSPAKNDENTKCHGEAVERHAITSMSTRHSVTKGGEQAVGDI